jgi:metal-sulfur cluster biosynthetic enzyme
VRYSREEIFMAEETKNETGSAVIPKGTDETPAPPKKEETQKPAEEPPQKTEAASGDDGVVSVDQVKLALRKVKDPDLSLNIMDLGLVYGIAVEGTTVKVDMTLTSPACPSGPEIMSDADRELRKLEGVTDVKMNLVWAPFWTPEKMEPRVRAYLGF